jgi:uncharacterized protein (DUF3820 family)
MTDPRTQLEAVFARLEVLRMPFGRYGPKRIPPAGAPLYDLPYEYLAWFARKGFPGGELGELMQLIYELKAAGADAAFDPLRQRAGGRTSLRPPRKRHYSLE